MAVRSDPGAEAARAVAAPAASAPPQPSAGPDLRLNIVHDQASGLFVYKFVDPTTGNVVHQFPDEALIKLRTAAEYAAGRLISTRV
jgi:hypothetical protein